MKREFTKEYILSNRGCYSKEQVEQLKCINNKTITLKQLFRDLPIKDFTWWLAKKCDLTLTEKRKLAIHCAEYVLPIFEEKYQNDDRPRKAIDAAKKVIENDTQENRDAADAAADAADAAAYAADAAADAAYAAAAAADAAAADAAYADAAAYAADAAADAAYAAAYAADAAYADAADAADAAYAYAADAAYAYAYRNHVWKFVEQL